MLVDFFYGAGFFLTHVKESTSHSSSFLGGTAASRVPMFCCCGLFFRVLFGATSDFFLKFIFMCPSVLGALCLSSASQFPAGVWALLVSIRFFLTSLTSPLLLTPDDSFCVFSYAVPFPL